MSDIVIIRRRRSRIESRTNKGAAWIVENFDGSVASVEFALELADEVTDHIEQAGLRVERR